MKRKPWLCQSGLQPHVKLHLDRQNGFDDAVLVCESDIFPVIDGDTQQDSEECELTPGWWKCPGETKSRAIQSDSWL